jgi:hypothetical protein
MVPARNFVPGLGMVTAVPEGTPPPQAGSTVPPQVAWRSTGCGQASAGADAIGPVAGPPPATLAPDASMDPALLAGAPSSQKIAAAPAPPNYDVVPANDHGDRGGQDIDTIVLHGTNGPASQTGADIVGFWNDTPDQASANYIIDRDGNIVQAVPDEQMAFHAGGATDPSINSRSIGIEFVSPLDGKTPPTDAQLEAGRQLVRYLAARYDVPGSNIQTHSQVGDPREGASHDHFGEDGTFDVQAFISSL